jgi:hypothetical protein
MAKKLHGTGPAAVSPVLATYEAEYAVIKSDLLRVGIINALFLVGILSLYYVNQQSGFLERWFQKLF